MAANDANKPAQAPAALTDAERAELEELRAMRAAQEAAAPAPTEDMDETIPGGVYVSGYEGKTPLYVNANGERVTSEGKPVKE